MCHTEVRVSASGVEGMRINGTCIGERSRKATRIVRRTKLRINCARVAAADAVTAAAPCPAHRLADGDVDRARVKSKTPARSHSHINSRAIRRWNAAHSWPAVLINNAQGHAGRARRICSFLPGFSPYQASHCENGRKPKNQPCCIRCFHTGVFFYAPALLISLCRNAAGALRFSARDNAPASVNKASGIFKQQR